MMKRVVRRIRIKRSVATLSSYGEIDVDGIQTGPGVFEAGVTLHCGDSGAMATRQGSQWMRSSFPRGHVLRATEDMVTRMLSSSSQAAQPRGHGTRNI